MLSCMVLGLVFLLSVIFCMYGVRERLGLAVNICHPQPGRREGVVL